jgi:hypothetical protein
LHCGIEKALFHFDKILSKGFIFENTNIIKEKIISDFKKIKKDINFDRFKNNISVVMEDSEKTAAVHRYFEYLEVHVLIPELENFIINLIKITNELKNGVRRNKYSEICTNLIENIVTKSIDSYNLFFR